MNELEQLVNYHLEHELDRGTVIRNVAAWKAATRKQILEDERNHPGYIEHSVLAITAKKDGRRLTYCSESRGTHAISYIYDPRGTTEPPAWWNRVMTDRPTVPVSGTIKVTMIGDANRWKAFTRDELHTLLKAILSKEWNRLYSDRPTPSGPFRLSGEIEAELARRKAADGS